MGRQSNLTVSHNIRYGIFGEEKVPSLNMASGLMTPTLFTETGCQAKPIVLCID